MFGTLLGLFRMFLGMFLGMLFGDIPWTASPALRVPSPQAPAECLELERRGWHPKIQALPSRTNGTWELIFTPYWNGKHMRV